MERPNRKMLAALLSLGVAGCIGSARKQPVPMDYSPGAACPEPDSNAAWVRVNREWHAPSAQGWSNDSLRLALIALRDQDQKERANFGARATDSVYVRRLMAADSALAAVMRDILDRFGLPTKTMVGADGSDAAMLIVQHNWALQERVLAIADTLSAGLISPQAHAMLEDRVHVHQGKPQRFGTHFNLGPDGLFSLAPAAEVEDIDARRARVGIMPLREYVCFLEEAGMKVNRNSLPPRSGPPRITSGEPQ